MTLGAAACHTLSKHRWIASFVNFPSDQVQDWSLQQHSTVSLHMWFLCSQDWHYFPESFLLMCFQKWHDHLTFSRFTHISLCLSLCFLFQPRMMVCGRTASPMSVALCCSKLSTTCWSAASWIVALFALASGLSNPTRRMRSPSTRGTLAPLVPCSYPYFLCCSKRPQLYMHGGRKHSPHGGLF